MKRLVRPQETGGKMKRSLRVVAVLASMCSATCFAEGGFIGATLGKADLDVDGYEDATSYSFLAGYQANENLAFEFSYYSTGEAEYSQESFFYGYEESAEIDGPTLSIVGIAPINERFEFYGRLGVWVWDAEYSFKYSDADFSLEASESEDGNSVFYGLGAQFAAGKNAKISLEFTKYEAGDEVDIDIDNISVGGRYYF